MVGLLNFEARKAFRKIMEHAASVGLTSDHIKSAVALGKEEELGQQILELFEKANSLKEGDTVINEFTEETRMLPKLDIDMAAHGMAGGY